jgi:hypothetical protein
MMLDNGRSVDDCVPPYACQRINTCPGENHRSLTNFG